MSCYNMYYVRCSKGAGPHTIWRPLVGPFETHRAAQRMVKPVRLACERAGLYKHCTFGVMRTDKHPKGKLDLALLDIMDVVEASK